MFRIVPFWLWVISFHYPSSTLSTTSYAAGVECSTTAECERLLLPGSHCVTGQCTNPFENGGCLKQMLPDWPHSRVCTSDDPPHFAKLGFCHKPRKHFEHTEIRILAQNWETSYFSTWLLQIILTELLDVPVTIETGSPDVSIDFYDRFNAYGFGTSNDWDAFRNARVVGDCRLLRKDDDETINKVNINGSSSTDGESEDDTNVYAPCAHVCPEVWEERMPQIRELARDGIVKKSTFNLGALGLLGLYVPKFTAERDPTLVSYFGLQGEENRQKLAERFKRPTTWGYYCDNISNTSCLANDGTASRQPIGVEERGKYFSEGLYAGHFRSTTKNICMPNESVCTGHYVDYTCEWTGLAYSQIYHHNIALESDGPGGAIDAYSYQSVVEIMEAANATKSDVMIHWWTPDALGEQFYDTPAELIRVDLKQPNQDCIENRPHPDYRCSPILEKRVGDPLGSCDASTQILQKVVSSVLENEYLPMNDDENSMATQSPALDAIKLFQIKSTELRKIFDYTFARGVDRWGYDPRHATCQWLVENIHQVRRKLPKGYPRILQDAKINCPFRNVALTFTIITLIAVLMSIVILFVYRDRKAIVYAQFEFLLLLLIGLLLISAGSIILTFHPSNASCVSVAWFVVLGYTLELVPLIVKVAALNRLAQAAKKMRRLVLSRKNLFYIVLFLTSITLIHLIAWTWVDPPRVGWKYELTDATTDANETIIKVRYLCNYGDTVWRGVAYAANFGYLLVATVLAFQTRNVIEAFNESRVLATMIYSHFIFCLIRIAFTFLEGTLDDIDLSLWRSFIYSLDVLTTLFIYFFPKFLLAHSESNDGIAGSTMDIDSTTFRHIPPLSNRMQKN